MRHLKSLILGTIFTLSSILTISAQNSYYYDYNSGEYTTNHDYYDKFGNPYYYEGNYYYGTEGAHMNNTTNTPPPPQGTRQWQARNPYSNQVGTQWENRNPYGNQKLEQDRIRRANRDPNRKKYGEWHKSAYEMRARPQSYQNPYSSQFGNQMNARHENAQQAKRQWDNRNNYGKWETRRDTRELDNRYSYEKQRDMKSTIGKQWMEQSKTQNIQRGPGGSGSTQNK